MTDTTTAAPKTRIARIHGGFLAPGVSKNRRLYTKANIAAAVETMQARIADPNGLPVTMMAHHPTFPGGDSRAIVAKVTAANYDRRTGKATYEADVPDTDDGRALVALTTPGEDGKRYLANVSIRGNWVGPVETRTVDGTQCQTADDLEVHGIDFTQDPGVDETRITQVILESAQREAGGNEAIVESAPEQAVLVTAEESAVEAVGEYLATITGTDVAEARVSMDVGHNGTSVSTSTYGAKPEDMKALLTKHSAALSKAMAELGLDDPKTAPSGPSWETAAPAASTEATASDTKEPIVAEETKTAAAEAAKTDEASKAAEPEALTAEAVTKMIAAGIAEALKAKPAETDTAAPAEAAKADTGKTETAATEATKTDAAALVEAVKVQVRDALRDELLAEGYTPGRKGLIRKTITEADDMAEKIKSGKATRAEIDAYANEAWASVLGN